MRRAYTCNTSASVRSRVVQVELPDEIFAARRWAPDDLAEELRLLLLLEEVRNRRIAYGRAAEMAHLSISKLLRVMGRHGITPFDYEPGELSDEMRE